MSSITATCPHRWHVTSSSRPAGSRSAKKRGVPSWSWLLVLVLGGRRVGLRPVDGTRPAHDVAQLMAKYGHG